ncbi:MAG: hypothetical protein ACKODM_10690 [Cytophagales bacterium]
MAGLSLNALRVGKQYVLVNFGDKYEFEIEQALSHHDYRVKDLHTLERYPIKELFKCGKGKDFEIRERDIDLQDL